MLHTPRIRASEALTPTRTRPHEANSDESMTGELLGVASATTSVRERECEMPSKTGGGAMAGGQGWPDRD